MISELTLPQMMMLLVGAIVAHAALFLASRKINVLFILATVILVLAPFSAAPELAIGVMVKWVRGYALVLLFVLGFFRFRSGALRPASATWLLFAALFVLAGAYSSLPHAALKYKVQFGLVALAGVFLAYSIRDSKELIRGLRLLCVSGGILAFVALVNLLADPASFVKIGRVNILGVIPTRIASNLAAMLLVGTYLALNERSRFWKTVAYCSCSVLAIVIAVTGSRASAAVVVMGYLIQSYPQSGRRLRMLMLPVFVLGMGLLALDIAEYQLSAERLISTTDTRTEAWSRHADQIMEKPLFGHGWAYYFKDGRPIFGNPHNAYMQVALDMGFLGLAFFVGCLLVVAYSSLQMYQFLRRQRVLFELAILPVSLIAVTLLDGLVTSATVLPSSLALMMALGIGLVDRLPELATLEKRRAFQMMAYRQVWRGVLGRGSGGINVPG